MKVLFVGCALFAGITLVGPHIEAPPIYPEVPVGCEIVGVARGEGFPLAHCEDGSYIYADMDGSDGNLGTEGDGRWLDASGYVGSR